MSELREPVGVIGVGWVGLVTAACFALAWRGDHP
jgi:UDP-N-acetyl-D-mannosaminuronate dehydrogenase